MSNYNISRDLPRKPVCSITVAVLDHVISPKGDHADFYGPSSSFRRPSMTLFYPGCPCSVIICRHDLLMPSSLLFVARHDLLNSQELIVTFLLLFPLL